MSWRRGSSLFLEVWPLIVKHIPNAEQRVDFTARLLALFVNDDMDPWDVEDVDPEIRKALKIAGIGLREPERYKGEG